MLTPDIFEMRAYKRMKDARERATYWRKRALLAERRNKRLLSMLADIAWRFLTH